MNHGPVEAKVYVPTIASLGLTGLYGLARSFGLSFNVGQEAAFAGVWLAVQPLLQFVLGYLARHTPRVEDAAATAGRDGPDSNDVPLAPSEPPTPTYEYEDA